MPDKIIFIATAWGSKYGGINAFNEDLACAVADLLSEQYQIVSVVIKASSKEVEAARKKGVELVPLSRRDEMDRFEDEDVGEILARITSTSEGNIAWWIGHDVFTGDIAIEAARASKNGRSAVIHHMDYEAYESYKGADGDTTRNKIERQRHILSRADLVFAVGPKLGNSAREKIAANQDVEVVELIPGLADISGVSTPKRFSVITFGRLNPQNDRIKQTRLAVAAFAHARRIKPDPLGNDAGITVIGLTENKSDDEYKELVSLAENKSGKAIQLNGWPYIDDRERLFDHLRRQSTCLMLSLHEGFGLAGWEAIAAEVPLIVSRNSGLYETLDNLLGGMGTGCITEVEVLGSMKEESFQEQDVETVSRALIEVKNRGAKAKQDAQRLKGLLNRLCTWRSTASTFAEACKLEVQENLADIKMARWEPEFLFEALRYSHDLVDGAARRKNHFQRLWDKMKPPSGFRKRLVLFGGIATALCNDFAAQQYANWLIANPEAHLYVCYETGPAALARARKLDKESLETQSGLSADAEQRMKEKGERVLALKDLILGNSQGGSPDMLQRTHIIPLQEPLTSYIIIADEDVYITPLFETRSSETLTFALAAKPPQFRIDVFNFILYHLQMLEHDGVANELIEELRREVVEGTER